MADQFRALGTYVVSFVFHLLNYPFNRDRYYLLKPILWFVAESGNILGKIQGLYDTRLLKINPANIQWNDPGG